MKDCTNELSHGCFIEYNTAYLHEYIKLSLSQIRVMGLVPIMLDNHREEACEVLIDDFG
jgi:tyrosine-protein phosphatase YwqE